MEDEIVKVKKEDLKGLMDANGEAYNILDEILGEVDDIKNRLKTAHKTLEDCPAELSDIVIEEEVNESEESQ